MGGGATHTVSLTLEWLNFDYKTFPLVFLTINTANVAITLISLGKKHCIAQLNLWVIDKFFIGQLSTSFLLDSDQQVFYWTVINKFFIGQ